MIEELVQQLLRSRTGSIEAPAGTGKTEQIALIAAQVPGRWLILTHTVAGADALRRRLRKYEVSSQKAQVDTLSAWSHRFARAYPHASGLPEDWSARGRDWSAVVRAATRLIESNAITSVLTASYDGVLIDEYQDCTANHHRLVCAISQAIRCYVFGDPLQAIFGFRNDPLADWNTQVLHQFPSGGTLTTPHRWNQAGNPELGAWLIRQREAFAEGHFDLSGAPRCVTWAPSATRLAARDLAATCAVRIAEGETLNILHTSFDEVRRADLAKATGSTTVEPVGGRTEREFYDALRQTTGIARVNAVLDFATSVYVGLDAAGKRRRVDSLLNNPRLVRVPASPAEQALCVVAQGFTMLGIIDFFSCVEREQGVTLVRPELLYCVRSALRHCTENDGVELEDAAWLAANARREPGRIIRNRSVGSCLLVKGLEFDHVVVTADACTSRQNWYVALTRATRTVKVLSPARRFFA
ncbi:DNA helicase-2/ATP-dependent DNA helicase PcrA [Paraburkholderia tropica]|uniref:DNA 3'-5' helicase II n=1 Tax=Paraburkholderia tropica TaxID=92647 RepID=A0ABX5MHF4_9BURK|nr:DNA helicase-2/ATP-dependent DNA helicase PcrA [Paraburkholderia tropica]PZW75771.1 DNA helicase-2/ATP-dependent DNA helicase PcrA [Paraburkholderia tropica]